MRCTFCKRKKSILVDCKYCKDTIIKRNIEYLGRITNTIHYETVESASNVYYVDGTYIKNVIIRKPKNE